MTVLVIGATGTTGGAVLQQLREAKVPVRALSRSAESAGALEGDGVESVVADLAQPDSLPAALEGVDAVYLAQPASPQLAEQEGGLAQAAAQAGVEHLVKLSVIGADPDSPIGFGRMHAAAEQAVRDSGVPWTFLRPNGFMQNTLAWGAQTPSGTVRGPVMDAAWSIVDVRDVAAVAVAALQNPGTHAGQTHTLTGPEPSTPREQVAILAEVLGLALVAEEVAIDDAKASMLGAGWPEWPVERMGELFELYADGLAAGVSPGVEQVLGRPATDFRTFAQDHREAFAGPVE